MKVGEPGEHVFEKGWLWQDSCSEVVGSVLLSESASWDDADTSAFEQLHSVEEVRLLVQRSCFLDGLLGDRDLWECIHGSLHWVTADAVDATVGLLNESCTFLERSQHSILLLLPEGIRPFSFLRWVDDGIDDGLSEDRRAELRRDHLFEEHVNFGVEI